MKFLRTFICPLALFVAVVAAPVARGDEFIDLIVTYGITTTLIGTHQTTTNDASGNPINFWDPSFEGAPASTVALSNPHMAAADAFGNIYIADKSSHSI